MKKKFITSEQIIKLSNLPDSFSGYKIIQLSDLHSQEFKGRNQNLITEIVNRNPDIILMTGDMINAKNDDGEVCIRLVKKLNRIFPIYYILGNHELKINNYRLEKYLNSLTDLGVVVIENSKVIMKKNKEYINLYGLSLDLSYYWNLHKKDRTEILKCNYINNHIGKPNNNDFNLLLVHNPKFFNTYTEWGADLVLSGHVHGGIVRLPFVGGLLSPDRNFFPKYDAGLYENGEGKMLVSRGLGNSTINFRLFNNPEIIEIVLVKEKLNYIL